MLIASIFDYGPIPIRSKVSSDGISGLPWKKILLPKSKFSPISSSILSFKVLVVVNNGKRIYSSLY